MWNCIKKTTLHSTHRNCCFVTRSWNECGVEQEISEESKLTMVKTWVITGSGTVYLNYKYNKKDDWHIFTSHNIAPILISFYKFYNFIFSHTPHTDTTKANSSVDCHLFHCFFYYCATVFLLNIDSKLSCIQYRYCLKSNKKQDQNKNKNNRKLYELYTKILKIITINNFELIFWDQDNFFSVTK